MIILSFLIKALKAKEGKRSDRRHKAGKALRA